MCCLVFASISSKGIKLAVSGTLARGHNLTGFFSCIVTYLYSEKYLAVESISQRNEIQRHHTTKPSRMPVSGMNA